MFYNTIGETGTELKTLQVRAKTQSEIILEFFESHPGQRFNPFEVRFGCGLSAPITSVRRAMTDLTSDGELIKHVKNKRPGIYKVPNCTWEYNMGQWEC